MMRKLLADRVSNPAVGSALLRRRLLTWYRRHGRRLPWREASDPYRIWVSEVMLQQTQVSTAIPFYQRFIGRFPTLMNLAKAREAEVLTLWSGLGYYSRARRLLEAARVIAREHHGRIPDDPEVFGRLPGVGRYTTGAVLSIAFDRPLPVVDGNVARVLSRLFAMPVTVRDPKGARELWRLADELVPMQGAGQWNQSLMELGALVCTPRSPRCGECPVRVACVAASTSRVAELPPAPVKRPASRVRQAVALLERDGALLMRPRAGRLLAGLWEPPGVEIEPSGSRPRHSPVRQSSVEDGAGLVPDGACANGTSRAGAQRSVRDRIIARRLAVELARHGVRARLEPTGLAIRHTITFRRIEVELWRGTVEGRDSSRVPRSVGPRRASSRGGAIRNDRSRRDGAERPRLRFVDPLAPRVAITGLARKIGRLLAAASASTQRAAP